MPNDLDDANKYISWCTTSHLCFGQRSRSFRKSSSYLSAESIPNDLLRPCTQAIYLNSWPDCSGRTSPYIDEYIRKAENHWSILVNLINLAVFFTVTLPLLVMFKQMSRSSGLNNSLKWTYFPSLI